MKNTLNTLNLLVLNAAVLWLEDAEMDRNMSGDVIGS